MGPSVLLTHPAAGVTQITLDRPDQLNTLDEAMVTDLHEALRGLATAADCRVVVLAATGRAFCAGLDLDAYVARTADPEQTTPAARLALQESLSSLVLALRGLPQPVVAAIQGATVGGGLGIALACDIRLAAPAARFGTGFIKVGLSGCDIGVSWLLPRIVGSARAFELLLTGRVLEAEEAERIGMVSRLVPADDLLDEAVSVASLVASYGPLGVRMTKDVMWSQLEVSSLRAGIDLEDRTQVVATLTHDHAEAVAAFLAHRQPRFVDR